MKKIISVILCALITLSACLITAFATDEDEEDNYIHIAFSTVDSDDTMLIISLDEKYVSFGEDISVDFTTFSANDENIDIDEIDETNATFETVTLSGDDLVSVKEKPADKDENGEYCFDYFLFIYIPHAGNISQNNFYKAEIPENTVFDAQGNGNKKITLNCLYRAFLWADGDCGYLTSGFSEKTKISFYISGYTYAPFDYYLDDDLVAENCVYYTINKAEKGTHTLTVKKLGIVIDEVTFDVYEIDKLATIAALFGESGIYLLTSLWSVPLSGLLFVIFPPLGVAGLAAPFASIGAFFSAIVNSFVVLFM